MSKNVEETVRRFAEPAVTALGYRLWDVEYESRGGYSELTLYIDKPDGGPIGTDDCERVSHAVDPLMDRYDPIEEAYTFSVSSCGSVRTLRRAAQFEAYIGQPVEVRLYRSEDGAKTVSGTLAAYDSGAVTLQTPAGERTFAAGEIAKVITIEMNEDEQQ